MEKKMDTEKKKHKLTWNQIALRILLWFFAGMFCCGMIAKSADSLTVAKVMTEQAKRSKLKYQVNGTGTVTGRAEKELPLLYGIKIDTIFVKLGDRIKKGQDLFFYNPEELENAYEEKKDVIRKAEIDYEKAVISGNLQEGRYDETTAQITLERAQEDLKTAEENLIQAEEELEKAKEKTIENFDEEQTKLYKKLEQELDIANEKLEEARQELEKKEASMEEDTRNEQRTMEDLEQKLADAENAAIDAEPLLTAFESAIRDYKYESYEKIRNSILDLFYGSEDARKNAESQLETSQKEYERAVSDRRRIKEQWILTMEEEQEKLDNATGENYLAVKRAYDLQVLARDAALNSANRAVEDASGSYEKFREGLNEFEIALASFQSAVYAGNQPELQKAKEGIKKQIEERNRSSEEDKNDKIQEISKNLTRVKEDLESAIKRWQAEVDAKKDAVAESKKNVDKVEKNIKEIKDDLDLENALSAAKLSLEQAKQDVDQKERSCKDAELALTQMREQKSESDKKEKIQDSVTDLSLESMKIDIDRQKEELKKWESLIKSKGMVKAADAGTVSRLTIQEGEKTSEEKKVSVSTDMPGFEAKISAEDAENIVAGSEILVDGGTKIGKIKAQVTSVEPLTDGDGYELKAAFSEQKLSIGRQLRFEFTAVTDYYETVIPLSALKEDNSGKYVLILSEQNSVLGVESIARKVSVTLKTNDSSSAAVEGALSPQDKIISGSNKSISEGDRVRAYE